MSASWSDGYTEKNFRVICIDVMRNQGARGGSIHDKK